MFEPWMFDTLSSLLSDLIEEVRRNNEKLDDIKNAVDDINRKIEDPTPTE